MPFPGYVRAAARVTAAAFRYPSFQLSKNRSRKPEVRWGHSFYVLSVTYRNRKFKMVLSKCCQKFSFASFAAQCFGKRRAKARR